MDRADLGHREGCFGQIFAGGLAYRWWFEVVMFDWWCVCGVKKRDGEDEPSDLMALGAFVRGIFCCVRMRKVAESSLSGR